MPQLLVPLQLTFNPNPFLLLTVKSSSPPWAQRPLKFSGLAMLLRGQPAYLRQLRTMGVYERRLLLHLIWWALFHLGVEKARAISKDEHFRGAELLCSCSFMKPLAPGFALHQQTHVHQTMKAGFFFFIYILTLWFQTTALSFKLPNALRRRGCNHPDYVCVTSGPSLPGWCFQPLLMESTIFFLPWVSHSLCSTFPFYFLFSGISRIWESSLGIFHLTSII